MKMKAINLGDFTINRPIIQGGMGIGVSLENLASAVSLNGGLGVISAAQIGFKDKMFQSKPLETNLRVLETTIKKAKQMALDKPIGVNIMAATHNYEEYVKTAVKAGVNVIISGAGLPTTLPKLLEGSKTKFAPIVSSLKATKLLLGMWEKRYGTTCDMIIVENHLAGGHLGFKEDQVAQLEKNNDFDSEFKSIVECVKDFEKKFNKTIPVIYAGGIFDKKDVKKSLSLGADGVQVGTKFVTTEECDASIEFKQAYVNAKNEDVVLVKSPVGLPGRAIKNSFTTATEREKISKCYKCLSKCDVNTTPYCISDKLMKSVLGDVDNGLVFCGRNAYKCTEINTVKDVMEELTV